MRYATIAVSLLGLAGLVTCTTHTPIGGLADGGGGTGGNQFPGTGGAETGGNQFPGTGGAGTGGNQFPGTGGATGAGNGSNDVCPDAAGGAAGRALNAPSFFPAVFYPIDGSPSSLALGDINGDGKPDLGVTTMRLPGTGGVPASSGPGTGGSGTGGANPSTEPGTVRLLMNDGAGAFAKAGTYTVLSPTSIAIGDLTGDGRSDLAITSTASGSLDVLPNEGQGMFGGAVSYSVGIRPSAVAFGNLNADGRIDVAIANSGTEKGDVAVLLNSGNGAFVAENFPAGASPVALVVADLNDDDFGDDVAVANASGGVSVLINGGSGIFSEPSFYAAGSTPQAIAVGDLNGDKKPDLVFVNNFNGRGIGVLTNLGYGNFGAAILYANNVVGGSVAIADFNGDGAADIAVSYQYTSMSCAGLGIMVNRGNGTFGALTTVAAEALGSLIAGDLNGDGKADLIGLSSEGLKVFLSSR